MSSFGPSDQQIAADEAASLATLHASRFGEMLMEMSREELMASLENEILKNEKLVSDIKELREEKIKISLILEEEDERRSNMFLKRMEELEKDGPNTLFCPTCAAAASEVRSRSNSISSLRHLNSMGPVVEAAEDHSE